MDMQIPATVPDKWDVRAGSSPPLRMANGGCSRRLQELRAPTGGDVGVVQASKRIASVQLLLQCPTWTLRGGEGGSLSRLMGMEMEHVQRSSSTQLHPGGATCLPVDLQQASLSF